MTPCSSCSRRSQRRSSVADVRVERAERLVEQQHLRIDGERPRERHPLALAARELRGALAAPGVRPTSESSSSTRSRDLLARALADPQPEGDVLTHAHVGERRVVLEDEPDPAILGARRRHVAAVDQHPTGVGVLEPGDDPQQRRLP